MITLEMMHNKEAAQMVWRRERKVAVGPAQEDDKNAPSVMSEEISCWRPGERFQPPATWGAGWPKTWRGVSDALPSEVDKCLVFFAFPIDAHRYLFCHHFFPVLLSVVFPIFFLF